MKTILSVFLTFTLLSSMLCAGIPVSATTSDDIAVNIALVSRLNGDIDGDWTVSTTDARLYLLPILAAIDLQPSLMDYDFNGVINTADVRAILSDILQGVAPKLIKPPVTVLTDIPVGESVAFSETASTEWWGGDAEADECYAVQSLEELQAFYATYPHLADCTASFAADFFLESALLLVKVNATALPRDVYIHNLVRSDDNALEIHLTEEYDAYVNPAIYNSWQLFTVAKEDLSGITELRIYEEILRDSIYELL